MAKERFKPCSNCGKGKIMTDELRRGHNGRVDGKQVCPQCVIEDFYKKFNL